MSEIQDSLKKKPSAPPVTPAHKPKRHAGEHPERTVPRLGEEPPRVAPDHGAAL